MTETLRINPGNAQTIQDYLSDAALQGLVKHTIESYRSSLLRFARFLEETPFEEVTLMHLRRYLGHLKENHNLHGKTILYNYTAVSSLCNFLQYENRIPSNPVPHFRKRYLSNTQREARKNVVGQRRLLSVEEMERLIHQTFDARQRTVLVLLAKTGIRRKELCAIEMQDIDWNRQAIHLKPTPKRTNLIVFYDDETSRTLKRWLAIRRARGFDDEGPLLVGEQGGRLHRTAAYNLVVNAATHAGLHALDGHERDRISPHCFRHWFTTHLRRSGMPREYISWLRGDAPAATMDIYMHNDPDDVRESYLAHVPQLGL